MPKTPAMHAEWIDHLRRKLDILQGLIDENAPDLIVANCISGLFFCAVGYLGKELTDEFSKRLITDARQRIGRCQHCDTDIGAAVTHPPVCEHCDAKLETWCDEMDQQIDELGGEAGGA
jgi:hypothetical protein